ncbi:single-stranded DNA-binding protein [Microbacterium sp. CFBP9034]|uniref:single-stranded DNA-binding protein n=1 Tax=Microbacterium sp. CFBP9034 TaxID=3096540 RepID=UPI002A6A93BB|nr:single-stranded DNA-binding protein [Microbacterium sp. CFBP9034]MDY0909562.1 single-stranded DNA-binding protein [Microbacterium sp. CFBP9034]
MSDTITVTGNVATHPDHKRMPSGVTITTFRVASGQRRFDRAANAWVDAGTNWYTVSAFRSLADHAFHSLRKGDRVVLTGRLRLREWDNGAKRGTAVEIDVEAIGHDLLWGTTTFVKDAQATGERHASPSPAQPADDWAAPGVTPDGAQEWEVVATEDDARPLNPADLDPADLDPAELEPAELEPTH